MAVLAGCQVAHQPVALGASRVPLSGVVRGHCVRFIDDDQVGGCAQEVVSSVFGLDEVGGDDGDPVAVEDRFVLCEAPFQASDTT